MGHLRFLRRSRAARVLCCAEKRSGRWRSLWMLFAHGAASASSGGRVRCHGSPAAAQDVQGGTERAFPVRCGPGGLADRFLCRLALMALLLSGARATRCLFANDFPMVVKRR
eukprot:Amastigsp_a13138_16.p3 type:complete len:112 gc:universal Amastigsp_a13138_16:410-75(-)